jgi:hypothetical protein
MTDNLESLEKFGGRYNPKSPDLKNQTDIKRHETLIRNHIKAELKDFIKRKGGSISYTIGEEKVILQDDGCIEISMEISYTKRKNNFPIPLRLLNLSNHLKLSTK